ncbi:MAG TPA: DUF4139 domain-containing protein [Steroidobacteraceae bacterium]|jgi:hypothetical protein|nr:DUF4139 domain-containing protein [Steroidobacteraceae bacterium]
MRRMAMGLAIAAGLVLDLASAADHDVSVTIYNDDLALVQDHRTINLTGGRQRVEFQNVSARIRPETVSLAANDLTIIEQNFDFDLLTPGKLMEKAIGQEITLVRVNPATGVETREKAQVLATNGGVVLKIGERIEVLRDDGLPVRVIFDKVPDNLRAKPTLSISVAGARSGSEPVTLSYLTPGLGWRADYVALFNEADSKIDVQGWVTLTNSSGTTFDDAKTLLVAGSPSSSTAAGSTVYLKRPGRATLQQPGTESGTRERLGDYYLYPLSERTTLANLQTKQVSFLDVHGIPAEHGYEYRNHWLGTSAMPESAQSTYRFSTSAHAGLGDQLPAGTLRFYLRDRRGEPQFIGENKIEHTPMGSTLSLATGEAFDVKVKATVDKRRQLGAYKWESDMHYELTNALPQPVTVTLLQDGLFGDTRITSESQKSTRLSDRVAQWNVSVPANGKSEVTASFESRF